MRFLPTSYYKNISDINYEKLKKEGIKCLAFDLDNTLAKIDKKEIPRSYYQLIKELKKDFLVVIISNNFYKSRVDYYADKLEVDRIHFACKPFTFGLKRMCRRFQLEKSEIVMIGDQMLTDIYSAYRFKVKSILIDPLGKADLKITAINRKLEKIIEKKYLEKGVFERGKYYE